LADGTIFSAGVSSQPYATIAFSSNQLVFDCINSGPTVVGRKYTNALYRDPSAWYHIVAVWDTTNGTAGNRMLLYVNGEQVTSFALSTNPASSATTQVNSTAAHQLGQFLSAGSYYDGEMAEINFVDGQALAPTAFGASSIYNQWLPIAYAGTYGTNGFYLPFTNTASTSTLVADSSGNGNNWTPNNISLTAGSTYDSLTDVPTLTSATVANYAVLNPTANKFGVTIADANLTTTYYPASAGGPSSTIGVSSGKWYFEFKPTVTIDASAGMGVGIANTPWLASGGWFDVGNQYYVYYFNGSTIGGTYSNGSYTSYSTPLTTSDVVGVAFDLTASTVSYYKNNVLVATVSIPSGQTWFATSGNGSSGAQSYGAYYNFGQRPLTYTAPSGFLPLNTFNI
jgi:hypothetical protein